MDKVTRRRLRAVAIFVIFLALAWAATQTFLRRGVKAPDTKVIFGEAQQTFDNIPALHRVILKMNISNRPQAEKTLADILKKYSIQKRRSGFDETGYGSYIFQVAEENYPTVIEQLQAVSTSKHYPVERDDDSLATRTLASEEASLQRIIKDLQILDQNTDPNATILERKADLDKERKLMESKYITPLREANTRWLFVQVMPNPTGSRINLVQKFVLNFFGALLGGFVIIVLAYYGTKLMVYLLALLGVKGFSGSNLGGGYSYGYGGYGNRYYSRYGYKGGKRKVKRIYKGKPGTSSEEEPEDTEKQ